MSHTRFAHPVIPDMPDGILNLAVGAVRGDQRELQEMLNELPAPIYTTDVRGRVTFCNDACVPVGSRAAAAGNWQLCTSDGDPLPNGTINQKHEIRGLTARARRVDGTRATFRPYPTPLFDELGDAMGAVNILIDIADRCQIERLRELAGRCRRLACSVSDLPTLETLMLMAEEYDEKARNLAQLN